LDVELTHAVSIRTNIVIKAVFIFAQRFRSDMTTAGAAGVKQLP
jgi:hypothetical protein